MTVARLKVIECLIISLYRAFDQVLIVILIMMSTGTSSRWNDGLGNTTTSMRWKSMVLVLVIAAVVAAVGFVSNGTTMAVTINSGTTSSNRLLQYVNNDGPLIKQPSTRFEDLVALLVRADISALQDLEDPNSPQYQAADWMANEDESELDLDGDTNLPAITQRYVLMVFYFAMGGPNWAHGLNFLEPVNECEWNLDAIVGDGLPRTYGFTCFGDTGTVRRLYMPPNFLEGSFPMELSYLTHLEDLFAFNNPDLTEPFPAFLQGHENIETIGLHYCALNGTLPEWVGDLTSLESLALSNNQLEGSLPENFSNLTNLQQLYLDDNFFLEVNMTLLANMTRLRHLILEQTILTSSWMLDDMLIGGWPRLEILDLSECNLTSTIPTSLLQHTTLRILDLHDNQLYGTLPTLLSDTNTALELLALNYNNLAGEIPTAFGQLVALKHLDLSVNQFTATIPDALSEMSDSLRILFLASNPFQASPIPSFLQDMTNLIELSLKNTARTGEIPSWIGNTPPDLTLLDLGENELRGSIPGSLSGLAFLRVLMLNHNQLSGTIPSLLSSLQYTLEFLLIEGNNLKGDAGPVCDGFAAIREFYSADCFEIGCSCCDVCCVDSDSDCNDRNWLIDADPIWELGFERVWPTDLINVGSYTISFNGDIP
ncbi:serine threonine-protein kinase BRI1-like [Seminavis robusta]|uniref:Serine threonine-protein kinase BRI1-like n=1 Tax=Seminavis robusta TaxID=568900 RepID=A0A9N8H9V0_9STRA|nr:serine threonine-protein kinase BRI1-like [Seminavis robusta]|eukprot:Sro127_g061000.1 serine threonine-protein kinase BRI1-like (655) ;mRNA; f:101055-103220